MSVIPTRMMPMGRGGRRLPYDAEVEFLESTGTQWIDTGFIGNSTTKAEIAASSSNTTAIQCLFGARNSNGNRPSFCVWQKATERNLRFDYNSPTVDSVRSSGTWNTVGVNTVIKDGRLNYLNGSQLVSNDNLVFELPVSFFLFNVNSSGVASVYPFVGRVFLCKIWQNGVLVRDFIPVRVGQTGYLYDKVAKQLFGNAGTGSFTLGPDK